MHRPVLGLSRRERALCAVLLAVITVTAGSGAWLTWRALKDQQVQLQGQAARSEGTGEHSLEADLTKRDGSTVLKPSTPRVASRAAPVDRSTDSRRSTPAIRTGSSTTVDGTVVAGVAVLAVLAVAAGAARLVVTRFRRAAEEAEGDPEVEVSPFRQPREDDPEPEPEVATEPADPVLGDAADSQDVQAMTQEVHELSTSGFDAQALPLTGLPAAADPPERSGLLQETAPALREALLLDEPAVPLQRSSGWEAEQDEPASREPVRSRAPSDEQDSSSFATGESTGPSERIFDRRVARRVPYVQSAWLWWGDANGPVTVQDLSGTGLRLLLASAASRPTLGQSVRILFPVSGTTVKAQARVQWRKAGEEGIEVGLEFLDLSPDSEELIQAVLLAAQ